MMQRKTSVIITYLFGILAWKLLQADPLKLNLDSLINKTFPHSQIGVMLQDAESGQILYQHNPDKLFSPASNIKLFTAAAALYQLSPAYHYVTALLQDDHGNIYIRFSGSPSLNTQQLKELLAIFKQRHMNNIKGNLVIDASRFSPPDYAAGISFEDIGWYYAAPSSAIILNNNAIDYEITPGTQLGKPAELKALHTENSIKLINKVITVNPLQAKKHCGLHIKIESDNVLQLYGCIAQNQATRILRLAIPNPFQLVKEKIQEILASEGVTLSGEIIEGKTPPQIQTLNLIQSAPLPELITHMLQESDNLYADSLTKMLGFALTGQGSYQQGVFAMQQILSKHTHLNMQQLQLTDGLGTRYNLVTPRQINTLLSDLYHNKSLYPLVINALPHMGQSGTLKDRMVHTILNNTIVAKTGTMHDISALSGYILLSNHRTLIFSIIENQIIGPIQKTKTLEDDILLTIVTSVDANHPSSIPPLPMKHFKKIEK